MVSTLAQRCGCQSRQPQSRQACTLLFPIHPAASLQNNRKKLGDFRARGVSQATKETAELRSALSGQVSTQFQEASAFLKNLGLDNPAEIARIVDIATNPQSVFVTFQNRKRSYNASARPLTIKDDIEPVVDYLRGQGLQTRQVVEMIKGHPPILSYSIEERIAPLFDYLRSMGLANPGEIVASRPSLIGLDVESNIKRILEYLRSRDYSEQDIIDYLKTSV